MSSNFHDDRAMPKKVVHQEVLWEGSWTCWFSFFNSFFMAFLSPSATFRNASWPVSIAFNWLIKDYITKEIVTTAEKCREGAVSEGPVHEKNKQVMKSCSCETGQTCFYTQYHSPMYHADTLHCRQFGCFSHASTCQVHQICVPRMATIPM